MAIEWNAVGWSIGGALAFGLVLGVMVRGWRVYRADRPLVDKIAYMRQLPFPHNLHFGYIMYVNIRQDKAKGEMAQASIGMMGMMGLGFTLSALWSAVMVQDHAVVGAIGLAVHGLMAVWIGRQGRDFPRFDTTDLELPRTPLEQAFNFVPSDLGANRVGEWGDYQRQEYLLAYRQGLGAAVVVMAFMVLATIALVVNLLRGQWGSVVPLLIIGVVLFKLGPLFRHEFHHARHMPEDTIIKLAGVRKAYFEYAPVVEDDVEYDRYALTHEGVRVVLWPDGWAALEDDAAYIFYCRVNEDNEATVLSVEVGVG